MVDTVRSLSALQALFADNGTGDISAQDLRDFLLSMKPPWGSFYRNVASATSVAATNTYYKAAGTSTAGSLYLMDHPSDGRLRYTGTPDHHFHIATTVSFTTAGSNETIGLKIAKNGTVIDSTVARRRVGSGTDIGSTALHADVILSTNDYLELFVANETNTSNITVDELYFFAMGMFI
jgi:hypothetical protein